MLRIWPGYRTADGNEPVARARRVKRRPRVQSAEPLNFPQAMLRICSGYRTAANSPPGLWVHCSPATKKAPLRGSTLLRAYYVAGARPAAVRRPVRQLPLQPFGYLDSSAVI
ncbi:hypothetical protein DDJ66_07305 [Klebsiella oxytoca]|nr:hypothetical protein DDJ34_06280 [Klebsiella oxytoca]RFP54531.1 hypothetical protein DDJ66_07305 [Klebsiella oxytoca]